MPERPRLRIVDSGIGLSAAHVFVLGTGGLNAKMIPHLCELGVGQLTVLDRKISGQSQLDELLDWHQPDAVAAELGSPAELGRWVNGACTAREIPLVCSGMWVTEAILWSVDPGLSGCLECALRQDLGSAATRTRAGQGIGPVAELLGALSAYELLRILSRFEEPAYAANSLFFDLANGTAAEQQPWPRDPTCPVCSPSFARRYR